MSSKTRRAIGIVRVSRIKGRDKKHDGEAFHSPEVQRERIEALCAHHGWRLVEVFDENEGREGRLRDASGAKSIAQRAKLRQAVEAIEAGRADLLVTAYADRLTWTHAVRDEVLDRVEAVGGQVWTADSGRQSNGTAVEEFSGTTLTAASRYVRRQAAEKARTAQVEAVEAGVWMSPKVPPGYVRGEDRHLWPDPQTAPAVAEAFRLRAEGATIEAIRLFLRAHGIERSHKGVGKLLHSHAFLGELRFGDLHNPSAHPAIVDRDLWRRVQRTSVPRGRTPKSERLLARLGVLRCGSCGSRMSVSSSNLNRYPTYRCGQAESCDRRQTISAPLVEGLVSEWVQQALEGLEGMADARQALDDAADLLERAELAYQAAVEALDPTEPSEVARLREFRAARDAARDAYQEQRADTDSLGVVVNAGRDWDALEQSERRDLIRAVVERIEVHPGRGAGRVRIEGKAVMEAAA